MTRDTSLSMIQNSNVRFAMQFQTIAMHKDNHQRILASTMNSHNARATQPSAPANAAPIPAFVRPAAPWKEDGLGRAVALGIVPLPDAVVLKPELGAA